QRKTAQNSNRKAAARVSLPYLISTMSMNKTEPPRPSVTSAVKTRMTRSFRFEPPPRFD
ncbi:hypothetical protein ABIE63_000001, partial [Limibacillus sp. MBR-115]